MPCNSSWALGYGDVTRLVCLSLPSPPPSPKEGLVLRLRLIWLWHRTLMCKMNSALTFLYNRMESGWIIKLETSNSSFTRSTLDQFFVLYMNYAGVLMNLATLTHTISFNSDTRCSSSVRVFLLAGTRSSKRRTYWNHWCNQTWRAKKVTQWKSYPCYSYTAPWWLACFWLHYIGKGVVWYSEKRLPNC